MATPSQSDSQDSGPSGSEALLRMTGVCKSFGAQQVLYDVDFDLFAGEVHVLAGENGAGKSTLIKILGGAHRPDRGEIWLHGQRRRFRRPRDAAAAGVAVIHQELSLVPSMSVADNVFLGHERSVLGWMCYGCQRQNATRALGRLGLDVDARQTVGSLPIAVQQMVEIGKALAQAANVIVMDEPTSALNEPEVARLFGSIDELKARGCGIIYITHKLEEVYRIADRITVLRDGYWVATASAREMPGPVLVRHMVGRDLEASVSGQPSSVLRRAEHETPVLSVEGLVVRGERESVRPLVDGVSFAVGAGEIVGLAGLHGSGNSDVLWGLFGAHGRRASGTVRINGCVVSVASPRQAIRHGMALVTNDRQRTGLVLGMDVASNVMMAALSRVSPGGWLLGGRERRLAGEITDQLQLRAASLRQPVATLSGGNQQKVVLAKWMATGPRVLLLDEPTRGVDVGAKQEIYALMRAWSEAGHAIVLITSELPELLMMSDRILVMHRGRIAASFGHGEASQEQIIHAAMGGA